MLKFLSMDSKISKIDITEPVKEHTDIINIVQELQEEKEKDVKQYEELLSKVMEEVTEEYSTGLIPRINKTPLFQETRKKEEEINTLYQRARSGENTFSEYHCKVKAWKDLWDKIFCEYSSGPEGQLNLFSSPVEEPAEEVTNEYIYITNSDTLKVECLKRTGADSLAVDTETTGLDPFIARVRIIQIAVKDLPVMIVDLWKIEDITPVRNLLTGPALKIFHNARFDLKMLQMAGIEVSGPLFDTMIAEMLLNGGLKREKGYFSLRGLAKRYLSIDLSKEEQLSDWSREHLSGKQLLYGSKDSSILLKLRDILRAEIVKKKLAETGRLEFDCIYSTVDMELNGIIFNTEKMEQQREKLSQELQEAEEKARKLLGDINLNSPAQVKEKLQALGFKVDGTDKDYLKNLDIPELLHIINYKETYKFFNDCFEKYYKHIQPATGRIHSNFFQLGTETGRFTNTDPALQTVPRRAEIRGSFTPAPGNKFVIADYSQIELRIGAELSKDETMIKAYSQGEDLHTLTASFITGKAKEEITKAERQIAKAVNFGLLYGAGAKTFKETAKSNYNLDLTLQQAEDFRNKYFQFYKGIKRWHEHVKAKLEYKTYTMGGRYRKFDRTKEYKITDRLNSPDQGTGADILKRAMVLLRPKITGLAKLIHIIHDEIILEAPENRAEEVKKILIDAMVEAGQYYLKLVPVEVECHICDSWAEK